MRWHFVKPLSAHSFCHGKWIREAPSHSEGGGKVLQGKGNFYLWIFCGHFCSLSGTFKNHLVQLLVAIDIYQKERWMITLVIESKGQSSLLSAVCFCLCANGQWGLWRSSFWILWCYRHCPQGKVVGVKYLCIGFVSVMHMIQQTKLWTTRFKYPIFPCICRFLYTLEMKIWGSLFWTVNWP